jgi:hypothetical protein
MFSNHVRPGQEVAIYKNDEGKFIFQKTGLNFGFYNATYFSLTEVERCERDKKLNVSDSKILRSCYLISFQVPLSLHI